MIKRLSIPTIGLAAVLLIVTACANGGPGAPKTDSAAVRRDYDLLTGTWQLTRGVVNGKPVPASVARNTILVTDHNTFRFPKASGIGTHPAGRFTINPDTTPKQVDSTAEGGPNAGQVTLGIYEIIDSTHNSRAGGRLAGHVRQNSPRLREAGGFFNTGKRLAPCQRDNALNA